MKEPLFETGCRRRETGVARLGDVIMAHVSDTKKGIDHPAVFPNSLADQLIQTFSPQNDLVVDVFAGSGTVLLKAQRLGRKYFGIDSSAHYVAIAQRRLDEQLRSLREDAA